MDASYLCSSHSEADHLEKQLLLAEIGFNRREYPTVTQFGLRSPARDWFAQLGAGRSARDKQVPASAMYWPADLRAALLAGYCDADGYESQRGGQSRRMSVSTVSRALAVRVAMLVRSLGHTPTFTVRSSQASRGWTAGRSTARRSPTACSGPSRPP
ncbi:LAGLIDADG family homing endonuclease [Nonomuraea dietziae]|uniref:LAGLIDADG family homing endonuclease n=1 Tax=Nonomuraea dietziae TaxID=65515 RepID=UPI00343C4581